MKLRWFIPFAVVAIAILVAPQSSADGGDDDDDEPEVWEFEIDGISYLVLDDKETVSANQCFSEEPDIVIPPVVEYEGKSYEVVKISIIFICCEPERISVPSTVEEIEQGAFNSPTLREIDVDPDNLVYSSIDGVLYDKGVSILIKYPSAKEGPTFILPVTVTALTENCFEDATSLINIWIPNTLYLIPSYAFYGCTGLTYVNASLDGNALPSSVRMIGRGAFENCTSLTQLEMPEDLVYIEEEAFAGSGLKTFTINLFLAYIGEGAFSNCPNLERFYDSNGSYEARAGMLYEIKGSEVKLHTYPCNRPDEIAEIQYGTKSLGRMAFTGAVNVKEVLLPSSLTAIYAAAFFNCTSLERISLPDSILEIDISAFYNCRNLREIELNDGLARIDDSAFGYTAIEHMTVPASVKYVGYEAFIGCSSLTSVDFMSDYMRARGNLFEDCKSMAEINFFETELVLDANTFSLMNNENLAIVSVTKDVELPEFLDTFLSNVEIVVMGERPYPMENLIGVAFCLLILILIVYYFRKVRAGPWLGIHAAFGLSAHPIPLLNPPMDLCDLSYIAKAWKSAIGRR